MAWGEKDEHAQHSAVYTVDADCCSHLALISKMIGLCTQGIMKWVPSPTTDCFTPENLVRIRRKVTSADLRRFFTLPGAQAPTP